MLGLVGGGSVVVVVMVVVVVAVGLREPRPLPVAYL
jgi:hypothetical protein